VARPDGAALLALAESIADGATVDWETAEAHAAADERDVIRQLRVLSSLAGLHRSMPAPADATTSFARKIAAAPAIGSWSHLELIERLGGGTSGDVYRAWDRHLEREVALKLLRSERVEEDLNTSRIANEGRLLARIRHTNVVCVHGVAVHDQRVGLWMELVRGGTLEEQLAKNGPLSAREAALIGIDLCRALAAIHGAGLIHRDVKAQNVMREDGGRIVLMDLGTGREADGRVARGTPELAGTPLYLAPEIFLGSPASARTDLYSLGVLLYRLVTASFPVRAATVEQLQQAHASGAVVRLRDARADLPTGFVRVIDRAIAPEPGRRYASAGELEADLADAIAEPAAPRVAVSAAPTTSSWPRWLTGWPGLAAGAVVLAAILAAVVMFRPFGASQSIRSIAVLPLANLSGDPSQEYLADGMTDEIIGTLGKLSGVNVISRTSVMPFKNAGKTTPEIAKTLNVDAIVEGSIATLPAEASANGQKRIRIKARLIYAGNDTQLWDRTFERVSGDVLALQSEVARAILDGIHARLTARDERALAANGGGAAPQADGFDLYLHGRYLWNGRTRQGLAQSVQYFQEAIARGYVPAYAGLADAYHLLGVYDFMPQAEARDRARAAATQGLQLDDSLAEAYASLGYVQSEQFEWAAGETSLKRAIDLKPGYAPAHLWYSINLLGRGNLDAATVEAHKALDLDPLSSGVHGLVGSLLVHQRRYDEAITSLERGVRQVDPNFGRIHLVLADAYALRGDYDRALAAAQRAAALSDDAGAQADIGFIHARAGRTADAQAAIGNLTARFDRHEDGAAGGLALVYAGLGDVDRGIVWLERARTMFDPLMSEVKVDPRLDSLRGDARFAKLLASIGLGQ